MTILTEKIKITIFVSKEKAKELKKRAIDAEMSLSNYLAQCSDKAAKSSSEGKDYPLNNKDT